MSDVVLSNARRLVLALETATRLGVDVLHAHIGQDGHLITVASREDAETLAVSLGVVERCRFGWRIARPGQSTIIELTGRPEVHPRPAQEAARRATSTVR